MRKRGNTSKVGATWQYYAILVVNWQNISPSDIGILINAKVNKCRLQSRKESSHAVRAHFWGLMATSALVANEIWVPTLHQACPRTGSGRWITSCRFWLSNVGLLIHCAKNTHSLTDSNNQVMWLYTLMTIMSTAHPTLQPASRKANHTRHTHIFLNSSSDVH